MPSVTLPDLKVEQAFELSDASAERPAAGCTIKLNKEPVQEYLRSNIVLMKNMIADGYQDAKTLSEATGVVTANADQIYKYMNCDQIEEYVETAKTVA